MSGAAACAHPDELRLRVTTREHWCGACGSIYWNDKWIAPSALMLPGWTCACGVFNGCARMELTECRSCGAPRTA